METRTYAFEQGETLTITTVGEDVQVRVRKSGASTFLYNAAKHSPASFEFSFPEDGTYEILMNNNGMVVGNAIFTCACAAAPAAPESPSKKADAQAVASTARGQTTVIVNNILSRMESVAPGAVSRDGRTATSAPSGSGLDQLAAGAEASKVSFRDVAGLLSFNTAYASAAAAESTDSGVLQRRDVVTGAPVTIWGHVSYTSEDNDFNKNGDDRRYDGDVWGYNLGADYRFRDDLVAGFTAGYLDTDLDTAYNSGTYKEKSWDFSPYLMYQPVDGATVTLIAGYSIGDVDKVRNSTVSGSTDSRMWHATADAEYTLQPVASMPLELTAILQYTWSKKTLDSFTESDGTNVDSITADTSQIKPGIEAAYSFHTLGVTMQPFVKTSYIHDFADAINDDSDAFSVGGGLRVLSSGTGLSGVIEGERQFARDDYSEFTIDGLLAYNFALNSADGTPLGSFGPYVSSALDADGGQVLGTGLKFASADQTLNCKLGATHALSSDDAGNTGARLDLELSF